MRMIASCSSRRVAALFLCWFAAQAGAEEDAGGARVPNAADRSAATSRADLVLGRIDADHDDAYLYRLPYADDATFPIIQGYGAKLSHHGAERFTLDFG